MKNCRLGLKHSEKCYFTEGISTGKIWHTFSWFWRKRKENTTILSKNRKNVAWAQTIRKSAILQREFQQGKFGNIFLFLEKEKKIKTFNYRRQIASVVGAQPEHCPNAAWCHPIL